MPPRSSNRQGGFTAGGNWATRKPDGRLARVLWNDPGTGVMRHADAGYELAQQCAAEQGLKLPMLG